MAVQIKPIPLLPPIANLIAVDATSTRAAQPSTLSPVAHA
jgi:hypothetical protein